MNKDWTGNKASYVTTNGFSNNREYERQSEDYYATEPKAVELLLELEDFSNMHIWECACGGGSLSDAMIKTGLKVYSTLVNNTPSSVNVGVVEFTAALCIKFSNVAWSVDGVVPSAAGSIAYAGLKTAQDGGDLVYYGALAATYQLNQGVQPIVPISSLTISET